MIKARPVPRFSTQSRGLGKRERTRIQLIDATVELIAEGGVAAATVISVAARAGVAPGTFYNHFVDLNEIIRETAMRIIEQIGAHINAAGKDESDLVRRFASGTRRFFDIVRKHPIWASAMLGSIDYLPSLRQTIYPHIGSTIHLGHEAGEFDAEDDLTFAAVMSMSLAGLRAYFAGYAEADIGSRIAVMQLRALGVDAKRAHEAAYGPLEEIEFNLVDVIQLGSKAG